MFRKNVAGQFIHVQGVDSSTGGIKSGVSWTVRRCLDGTFAAATGTATEDGTTGWYKFALSQADTNGNNCGFNFTGTGAVPQTVNIVTTALDPTSTAFGLSIAKTTNITGFNDIAATAVVSSGAITTSGGAVSTVTTATNVTTVNGLAANVITAAATAADFGTEIANAVWDTDATTHQTQGTFGQVIGDSGADADSIWALANTNLDAAVSSRMATYTQPTGFLAATFPAGTVANTTNITAGTITTTTNLTNLPAITANWLTAAGTASDFGAEMATAIWTDTTAGDFTTALSIGKSVMNGVALGTGLTINAYTGNTPQTGDAYARLGAPAGASVSADVAAVKVDTAAILDDTGTSGVVVAAASKTGYALSAAGITAVWAEVVEGAVTAVQMMRGFASALMGKASGLGTTTAVFRDVGDTKDRLTATVDADGNRTAITKDLT